MATFANLATSVLPRLGKRNLARSMEDFRLHPNSAVAVVWSAAGTRMPRGGAGLRCAGRGPAEPELRSVAPGRSGVVFSLVMQVAKRSTKFSRHPSVRTLDLLGIPAGLLVGHALRCEMVGTIFI